MAEHSFINIYQNFLINILIIKIKKKRIKHSKIFCYVPIKYKIIV